MRIAIFCYPADDGWLPDAAIEGIGGSEEAVIHAAAAMADSGHDVVVVNCAARADVLAGAVTYSSYTTLIRRDSFDVGIVWRRPGLARWIPPGVRVGRLYLWLHDAIDSESVTNHSGRYHKVMILSRFHRSLYPNLPSHRFFLTSNGIIASDFAGSIQRDPQLVVYGSAYERGLRALLESWGDVRRAVPRARLHVFYGWQTIRRLRVAHYERIRPYFDRMMMQPGVTHLGRVGHAEVARQYKQAGVWAYPCSFPEVSCISAMKAQAGGAVPVVIPTGALRETVRYGFSTMRSYTDYRGMPLPRRILDEWRGALIELLRSPRKQESIRREMRPVSLQRFTWRRVIDRWLEEFSEPMREAV